MGIIRDFNDGRMEALRSISYSETGTETPYVTTEPSLLNSLTQALPDAASRRINDTARIAKMLIDKPGLKWIGNQTLLSRVELERKAREAAEEKNGTGVGNALAGFAAAAGQVLKIVGSTVAQVPVNGTGTHFVRGFTPDTYLRQGDPNGVLGFLGFDGENGAAKALNGETIIPDNEGQEQFTPLHGSEVEFKFSKFRPKFQPTDIAEVSIDTKTTVEENPVFTDTERTTELIDYRKLRFKGYNSNTYSLDYSGFLSKEIVKEQRVGLGNQGKKKGKIVNYTDIDPDRVDQINRLGVSLDPLSGAKDARDLISLNFEVITPDQSYYLYFRAYLDQFSDSHNADWGTTKYIGRADDFYTYNGYSRQVSLGFKIAASTRVEMDPLYQKMATLASATTPTYGGTESKFMRGTIARVTVGDYLYKVPGIIDTVNFNWETNYPWEINMQGPERNEDPIPVVPHLLDCSLSFRPIHDFIPQAGYLRSPGNALIRNNSTKPYYHILQENEREPVKLAQVGAQNLTTGNELSGTGVGITAPQPALGGLFDFENAPV